MRHKIVLLIVMYGCMCLASKAFSQAASLSINNSINTGNSLTFSASTAGADPTNLSTFNTTSGTNTLQNVKYSWRFLGSDPNDPTTYTVGNLTVKTNVAIPSGLSWSIAAAAPPNSWNGTTTGPQIIGTTTNTLLSNVWSTSSSFWLIPFFSPTITNTLSQILSVTNFADLRPIDNVTNTTTITLTYELY